MNSTDQTAERLRRTVGELAIANARLRELEAQKTTRRVFSPAQLDAQPIGSMIRTHPVYGRSGSWVCFAPGYWTDGCGDSNSAAIIRNHGSLVTLVYTPSAREQNAAKAIVGQGISQ